MYKKALGVTKLAKEVLSMEEKEGRHWEYVAERDSFYLYENNKGYWKAENIQYLLSYIRKHILDIDINLDSKAAVKETLEAMKTILIDHNNMSRFNYSNYNDISLINLKNGMLNWKDGKFLEHNKSYYSQIQLNVEYDENAKCPRWEKALKEWLPDVSSRLFLQEYIGYCLIPDTSRDTAVVLLGEGSNGKSTFIDIVRKLIGSDNISSIPLSRLGERFETAYLQNTIVNICADIDCRYIEYTGVIKSIISGESIRGEYKNGASFDFKPLTRLIFSANKMPKSKDKSYAWYRRFQIIKFPNKFNDNSEPGFEKKLNNEIPGIFNWALEGLKRLESQGHFTIAEEMKSNIYDYKNNHNDTVAAFLNENTTKYEGSFTVVSDLYAEYVQYCEALCLEVESLLSFGKRMAQLGFPSSPRRVNGKSQRCYLDIKKVS